MVKMPPNCLSVLDNFKELTLKGLKCNQANIAKKIKMASALLCYFQNLDSFQKTEASVSLS